MRKLNRLQQARGRLQGGSGEKEWQLDGALTQPEGWRESGTDRPQFVELRDVLREQGEVEVTKP